MTTQEGVPYWHPEHKEKPMPKYKIEPIPGMPEWFTPGIVCRVKTKDMGIWCSLRPIDRFWGYYKESPFEDRDGKFWAFAEPVEQWERQEGEWVAAWGDNTQQHIRIVKYLKRSDLTNSISGTVHETSAGLMIHVARLVYPDGRVIDCACSVEELKNRTEWV